MHWLDWTIARSMRPRLFTQGWGDPSILESGATRGWDLEPKPPAIQMTWDAPPRGELFEQDGSFLSPRAQHLPPEARTATIRSLGSPTARRAVVLLAASGEEGFAWRQRLIAPLCRGDTRALILENALYGLRRPGGQRGADLRHVTDLVNMNRSTIEEARALVEWLREQGHRVVGVAGFSLGGHMAALAAAHLDRPTAVAALATGRSPALIYTRGALSHAIAWDALVDPGQSHAQAKARLKELFLPGDLDRVPPPVHQLSAIIVSCDGDGYVSPEESRALHRHWPRAELRRIGSGHAMTFVLRLRELRGAIRDSLQRLEEALENPHRASSEGAGRVRGVELPA